LSTQSHKFKSAGIIFRLKRVFIKQRLSDFLFVLLTQTDIGKKIQRGDAHAPQQRKQEKLKFFVFEILENNAVLHFGGLRPFAIYNFSINKCSLNVILQLPKFSLAFSTKQMFAMSLLSIFDFLGRVCLYYMEPSRFFIINQIVENFRNDV